MVHGFYLLTLIIPDAFNVQGAFTPGNTESLQSYLCYFSFITLTTLGYGDIVPVHPMARMLVSLEGVVGQLFPAILIAQVGFSSCAREGQNLKVIQGCLSKREIKKEDP